MKIAFATFAGLPNPAVLGGAVETLIDDICNVNETRKELSIDVFSVNNELAREKSKEYSCTDYNYYFTKKNSYFSKKNIVYKITKKSIPNKTMNSICKTINNEGYDFVIVTSINAEFKYVFKKIHSKVIWYLHGDPISILPNDILKDICKQCCGIITVSDFINKRISSVGVCCPVKTLKNCASLIPVSKEDEAAVNKEIREKYKIDSNDILYLYFGRITKIKGIFELIQAFNIADIQNAKLLIVGKPSNDEETEYYNELKRISDDRVIFAGYVDHSQLNKVICASNIVAVPSICHEAAGLSVIESVKCKKRLICSNMGGIPEYAKNAIMVDYDSDFVDSLADAIKDSSKQNNMPMNEEKSDYSVFDFYDAFVDTLAFFG